MTTSSIDRGTSCVGTCVTTSDLETDSVSESEDEELRDEDIQVAYQVMYKKWIKLCEDNERLKSENSDLKGVLRETKMKLESSEKTLRLLDTGKAKLDHIMTMGKRSGDYSGLGYMGEKSKAEEKKMSNVFVRKSTSSSQNRDEGCSNTFKKNRRFVPICHY